MMNVCIETNKGEREDRDPVVLEAGNYARDFPLTTASLQSGSTMRTKDADVLAPLAACMQTG